MRKHSRKLAAAAALTIGLGGLGVAFATWTASGTGAGQAKATTSKAITGTANTATTNDDFYPGSGAVDATAKLSNPNHFGVTFTGWTAGAVTVVSSNGTCAAGDFVAHDGTFGSPLSLSASAVDSVKTIPGLVEMKSSALDGCQNAVVNVAFTLTGGAQA